LKTDGGYPKDTGVNKPWQPLGIPFSVTPIGQLHQSSPSPIPGDLGRGPSQQSHVLEHRDTYGQAQVCSKGHQGSSVLHEVTMTLGGSRQKIERETKPEGPRIGDQERGGLAMVRRFQHRLILVACTIFLQVSHTAHGAASPHASLNWPLPTQVGDPD